MSKLVWALIAVNILLWLTIGALHYLNTVDLTPDAQGLIHHPLYGTYPKEVPFEQGMTIYPGQQAVFYVPSP